MPHPTIHHLRIENAARLIGYCSGYGRRLAKRGVFGRLIQITGTKGLWVELAELERRNCEFSEDQIEDAAQPSPVKRTWPKKFSHSAVTRILQKTLAERDADWLAWFNRRGYTTTAGPARRSPYHYMPE